MILIDYFPWMIKDDYLDSPLAFLITKFQNQFGANFKYKAIICQIVPEYKVKRFGSYPTL